MLLIGNYIWLTFVWNIKGRLEIKGKFLIVFVMYFTDLSNFIHVLFYDVELINYRIKFAAKTCALNWETDSEQIYLHEIDVEIATHYDPIRWRGIKSLDGITVCFMMRYTRRETWRNISALRSFFPTWLVTFAKATWNFWNTRLYTVYARRIKYSGMPLKELMSIYAMFLF